jgi:hypothetical protein
MLLALFGSIELGWKDTYPLLYVQKNNERWKTLKIASLVLGKLLLKHLYRSFSYKLSFLRTNDNL